MVVHHAIRGAVVITATLAFSVASLSCKRPDAQESSTQASAKPPDHLAPGELVEGRDKAFALPLPRAAKISMRTATTVLVATPYPPEQLANFVRSRVSKGNVVVGASKTTFEDVIAPGEPTRHLRIDIEKGGDPMGSSIRSIMTVLDVTPPPPPDPNTTVEERFKKAGLKPNGEVLDPKHLQ